MVRVLTFTLLALVTSAGVVSAQEKKLVLRDFPFWTAPKVPHAREFVPGLQAALNITADQVRKIEAACHETIDKPEAKVKGNSGQAVEKVHTMVREILTDDQKKLIEKLNDLYAKVLSSVNEDFQPDFTSNKGNDDEIKILREKMRDTVVMTYREKLVGMLSNEQMKAVERAAEEHKKREEANKKKPGK